MPEKKLTRTMQQALDYIREHGKIVRYPGGFWAKEGWRLREGVWFGSPTLNALVDRGVAVYTEWKETERGTRFPIEAKVNEPERDAETANVR